MFETAPLQTDHVRPDLAAALAATLGLAAPGAAQLPPLWHWLLFLDRPPAASLGADGHRAEGGLVTPPPGLPRRMWAGGRLYLHRPLTFGQQVRCESAVIARRDRAGSAGRLHFVTLGLRILSDMLLLEEERDLVYRSPATASVHRCTAPAAPAPAAALRHTVTPDAVMLFRFSALTFNAHRIHYDADYCREVEFYPGVVVHGPLQAILLASLLAQAAPAHRLRRFSYRSVAPAYAGEPLTLEAWPDPVRPDVWQLRSLDPNRIACMTAEAEWHAPGNLS
jgi:3-methylfumaryl-CoA hydratase